MWGPGGIKPATRGTVQYSTEQYSTVIFRRGITRSYVCVRGDDMCQVLYSVPVNTPEYLVCLQVHCTVQCTCKHLNTW